MTPSDAARLLAVAAIYDNRTIGETEAQVWADDLGDILLDEAVAAVREHYTNNPDKWLKAGHVIAIVRRNRRNRLDHSWITEAAAMRRIDPNNVALYLDALRATRQRAAAAAAPQRPALPPGKYDATAHRIAVNARGAQLARQVLAARPPRTKHEAGTPALDRLRDLTDGPNWPPTDPGATA